MAHFAKLDENNKVIQVIVVSNDDCGSNFPESEPIGQSFIASLGLGNNWKQCSYNGNFRRKAHIGSLYIAEQDIFTSAQPFPSWTLSTDFEWQSPVAKPALDGIWVWDEPNLQWVR